MHFDRYLERILGIHLSGTSFIICHIPGVLPFSITEKMDHSGEERDQIQEDIERLNLVLQVEDSDLGIHEEEQDEAEYVCINEDSIDSEGNLGCFIYCKCCKSRTKELLKKNEMISLFV